ncbi:GNAT family N-acetyltransferase [Curtobacterium sp. RRHDQ10]|uniref:GNAT family N-acetyltransferase n=1 Tax=Curtobacterium phyllosphaerae TaxID=3413379 RepID=UPI003BF4308C
MVTSASTWSVRSVEPADAEQWAGLYSGYRAFYRLPDDPGAVSTTWGWVVGREHGLHGLVAVDRTGRLGALANLRTFVRPSAAGFGLYLDDLFTDPDARRNGLGGLLLDAAASLAAAEGTTLVRWITAEGNAVARSLYDTRATATPWVTYDMAPAAPSGSTADPRSAHWPSTRSATADHAAGTR